MSKHAWLLLAYLIGICSQTFAQTKTQRFGLENVIFVVKLLSPLSTQTAKVGESVTASVQEPNSYENGILEGQIVRVKRSNAEQGKSEIEFTFYRVTATGGKPVPIKADLREFRNSQGTPGRSDDGSLIHVTSTRASMPVASRKKDRVVGSVIGAAAGGIPGAAIGAARLGPVVIGVRMTADNPDITLGPGSVLTLNVTEVPNTVVGSR